MTLSLFAIHFGLVEVWVRRGSILGIPRVFACVLVRQGLVGFLSFACWVILGVRRVVAVGVVGMPWYGSEDTDGKDSSVRDELSWDVDSGDASSYRSRACHQQCGFNTCNPSSGNR